MSTKKQIEVPGIGLVNFTKRKTAKNIRVGVNYAGDVNVSLPSWTPYRMAIAFVNTKKDWINQQKTGKTRHVFQNGERIGKAHRLYFTQTKSDRITSRVTDTEIRLSVPQGLTPETPKVQNSLETAAVRALKKEAQKLLLPRLKQLADKHGFSYRGATIKQLKSRWGSCSSQKDIVLSCYLMQLPWNLIDYVLLHELLHTRVMRHGEVFWSELEHYVSDLPERRKAIKQYHPSLSPQD